MSSQNIDNSSYENFRVFLEKECGIVLGANKQYLVKSRLTPLLGKFQVNTLDELIAKALKPTERQLRAVVIDSMTTNETLWFRDDYPFNLLQSTLFPEHAKLNRPLKIWSAASSSGQEPYSIAMSVLEYQQKNPTAFSKGVQITATDISPTMLEHCKYAHYDKLAISRGLSAERKRQFFEPGDNEMLKVTEKVKKLVNFKSLNLLDTYQHLGRFDIIFCRNVLIYFSPEIKSQIIGKFHAMLDDKGYLFLGASESMSGLSNQYKMHRCNPGIIYQKD